MNRKEEADALSWEALRQGTSYGKLVAALGPGEAAEILLRYRRARDARERMRQRMEERKQKKAAAP